MSAAHDNNTIEPGGKSRELRSFLLLSVVLAPALSVAFVGGLGLIIWVYQMIAGPPGPPPA
ncbi:periplasmic nitrate reductase, NapE protein [Mesorhizobium sp. Z1-4]|uniref:periplasmic nitrate reductase, NapE protein n=1 Tax=Mesorhizobium sp. Z1-4 TaxID=2448478 RepID=UPI000FD8348C|nr:periplasmic nitrate reductase, NapE protein [Mesorhizobium sp. Z1-4]